MGKQRRRFTLEYKVEAVRLALSGAKSQKEVAKDLNLNPETLYRRRDWVTPLFARNITHDLGTRTEPSSNPDPVKKHRGTGADLSSVANRTAGTRWRMASLLIHAGCPGPNCHPGRVPA